MIGSGEVVVMYDLFNFCELIVGEFDKVMVVFINIGIGIMLIYLVVGVLKIVVEKLC